MSRRLYYVERTPGRRLRVESRGSGTPLIVLPGISRDTERVVAALRALEREFEVVAVDPLGQGHSSVSADPAAYALEEQARDVVAVVAATGFADAHLLGCDTGARIALGTAALHPEVCASLVLCAPRPGLETSDALPHVEAPVLVLATAGEAERAAIAGKLARGLPRAELCEIEDTGRAAHFGRDDALVHVIRDFLRRAPRPRPASPPSDEAPTDDRDSAPDRR